MTQTNQPEIRMYIDPQMISAVEQNLSGLPHSEYVGQLVGRIKNLFGTTAYLWGGAVRDPILKGICQSDKILSGRYSQNLQARDVDVLIDDSQEKIDLQKLVLYLPGRICWNRFGTPKWKPEEGIEIDITPFSNASNLRKGERLPVNLETALKGCDLTTSAIAYSLDPANQGIYDCGAIDGYKKREVELLYQGDDVSALMCRIVMQADKLDFKIGPKATRFIQDNYSPIIRVSIESYLRYKEQSRETYNKVIETFEAISKTKREIAPFSATRTQPLFMAVKVFPKNS